MKDDEKDIRFRDECAMRILTALLSRDDAKTAVNTMYCNAWPEGNKDWYKDGAERMEMWVRMSYKIADMMRRARLASFE